MMTRYVLGTTWHNALSTARSIRGYDGENQPFLKCHDSNCQSLGRLSHREGLSFLYFRYRSLKMYKIEKGK
jgi:hypothetical protein